MRCYYKRVVTFFLSFCVGLCVLINIAVFNNSRETYVLINDSQTSDDLLKGPSPLPSTEIQTQRQNGSRLLWQTSFPSTLNIWPNKIHPEDDRILTQINFVPNSYRAANPSHQRKAKVILLHDGTSNWGVKPGQATFIRQKCPVNQCHVTSNRAFAETADVVLFKNVIPRRRVKRASPNQIWALYLLESPYHTTSFTGLKNLINWTATYRHDSTIVTPYEKFVPYNTQVLTKPQTKNYASGKTKKVAWFVSNCGSKNKRLEVAKELAKYIEVDIYGACGPLKCPRFQSDQCYKLLNQDYKFYLSFENSNCVDYITEKFFVTGLQNDIIPIVMGARPEDYKRAAPHRSFIHVEDFPTVEELAGYLHTLDQNDDLYNEYFKWKGTGRFVNTYFWCRLCALAHDSENSPAAYSDVNEWWRGEGVCIGNERWSDYKKRTTLVT